jgi:hypothetical protein
VEAEVEAGSGGDSTASVVSVPAARSVCSAAELDTEAEEEAEADGGSISETAGAEEEGDADSTAGVIAGSVSFVLLGAGFEADADSIEEPVETADVIDPVAEAAFKALMTKSAPRSCITLLP